MLAPGFSFFKCNIQTVHRTLMLQVGAFRLHPIELPCVTGHLPGLYLNMLHSPSLSDVNS